MLQVIMTVCTALYVSLGELEGVVTAVLGDV